MLHWIRPLPLLLMGMAMIICAVQAGAQTLDPTPMGLTYWDSTNQILFSGRGPSSPGVLVRSYEGTHQRGADIDISKDFPGAREVYVDRLTAGPDGTTLIATILNFGDRDVRQPILTYDSSGRLVKSWSPPQYAEAIAYSKDDDAVFVLGDRDAPEGPDAPDYPLLVEYDLEGHVLKSMIPASTLMNRGDSFRRGGEIGEPALRVTKDRIYVYAPADGNVVICNRDGQILTHLSIRDVVERISKQDGYQLVQTHALDFTDDGNIVLELLLAKDNRGYELGVFRINVETAEATLLHKTINHGGFFFVGAKDSQYLYLWLNRDLYVQVDDAVEPVPLNAAMENRAAIN
jgi:hypothetical protein